MNQFNKKFKLIFVPFLLTALATIGIYTFLNWLLFVKIAKFSIDEVVFNVMVPLAIPWIPILVWIRPRVKMLNLKRVGRGEPVTGILFLNWLTIGVALIMAQLYMLTATGKLTRLDNIIDIKKFPPTKYYTVKHFYSNKHFIHVHNAFRVSNKGNDFDMTIYGAVPVFNRIFPDTTKITAMQNRANIKALIIINGKLSNRAYLKTLPADSIRMMRILNPSLVMPMYGDTGKYGAIAVMTRGHKFDGTLPPLKIWPVAWLCIKYSKTIHNSLSPAEKQRKFKDFVMQSDQDFKRKQLDKFVYLDRVSYSSDLTYYTTAIDLKGDVADTTTPIVLMPVFDSFENRNGDKLIWLLTVFGAGSIIFLVILSLVKLKPEID